jgi:hypothetical protein
MNDGAPGSLECEGAAALTRMEEALQLLDRCDGVLYIVPHLDLAICRLKEALEQARPETAPTQPSGGPAQT